MYAKHKSAKHKSDFPHSKVILLRVNFRSSVKLNFQCKMCGSRIDCRHLAIDNIYGKQKYLPRFTTNRTITIIPQYNMVFILSAIIMICQPFLRYRFFMFVFVY